MTAPRQRPISPCTPRRKACDEHENGVHMVQVGPWSGVVLVLSGKPFAAALWRSAWVPTDTVGSWSGQHGAAR